jgi:hypothetical protein
MRQEEHRALKMNIRQYPTVGMQRTRAAAARTAVTQVSNHETICPPSTRF